MRKNNIKTRIILMVMVMVMALVVGCRRNEEEAPDQSLQPGDISQETEAVPETDNEENPADDQYYVLYLKHKDQAFIFSDTYRIKANDPKLENKTLPEFVIEELIKQKGVGELINPIHPETKVLSIQQEGKKITLNLSGEFADGMTGTVEDTEATIAMVVNTLITLPSIDQVSLLIDGNKPDTINGLGIMDVYGFITEYYPDK